MDFIDEMKTLSSKILKQINMIQTEEATKNAFVMPFISALGYNVFDPAEVTPELSADVGLKKGEKVDYAILKEDKPIILFECKWCGANLDEEHASQLYRYFNVTEARFGVLTNGVIYRFYTDIEEPNKMDSKPFLEFNMLDIKDSLIDDLKKFRKQSFNLDDTLTIATELKYTKEIKRILSEQLTNPSEEFVKFFASQIHSGRLTQAVKQQFSDLTKKAIHHFINDRINERLKSALSEETSASSSIQPTQTIVESENEVEEENKIITTQEEWEGYYIVKSILREIVDANRVSIRDSISCCRILLDDNIRKPICRLYFNNLEKKQLGLIDTDKKEEKIPINELDQIYQYANRIKTTVDHYEDKKDK